MNYHILNGDALKFQFPKDKVSGELIIARECLIEGSLAGNNLDSFWNARASFIQRNYGEDQNSYHENVVKEFEKIKSIPITGNVHFWFEDDLFCMANFWFSLSLLNPMIPAYIVKPKPNNWKGFGAMHPDELHQAFVEKQLILPAERALMLACWQAYKTQDLAKLKQLSADNSPNFPQLAEVCQAHIDRFPKEGTLNRPAQMLKNILSEQSNKEFKHVFPIFHRQAGIYGFGDMQVKRIYDQVMLEFQ